MLTIYPVILAGGTGTRIWPQSRTAYPKQFLNLHHPDLSMLQETLVRLDQLVEFNGGKKSINLSTVTIISNEQHRFLVAQQLLQLNMKADIILEPVARNTAAAIAIACLHLLAQKKDSNAIVLVLPADHVIDDKAALHQCIHKAQCFALQEQLVTFGIVPNTPAIGYGYIKRGQIIKKGEDTDQEENESAHIIDKFVEKPDLINAQRFLKSGKYLWNSGMFMFKAQRYLALLELLRPDIHSPCVEAFSQTSKDFDFIRIDQTAFEKCPSESIDYALMEPLTQQAFESPCTTTHLANTAVVVPLDAGWNDIGSWSALWDISPKDGANNVLKGDVITHRSTNNYVVANSKLIATVGIQDLIVVDTKDALLVADKSQVQDVKHIVDKLKNSARNEHNQHREVCRPWGKYDLIFKSEHYQVKKITVNPGAKLSVQLHHHRAEHWIVVSGCARVTSGDKNFLLKANESTYIPIGQIHSLENPEQTPLEMIEVQSGSYLGEDDIVRFEDRYGR